MLCFLACSEVFEFGQLGTGLSCGSGNVLFQRRMSFKKCIREKRSWVKGPSVSPIFPHLTPLALGHGLAYGSHFSSPIKLCWQGRCATTVSHITHIQCVSPHSRYGCHLFIYMFIINTCVTITLKQCSVSNTLNHHSSNNHQIDMSMRKSYSITLNEWKTHILLTLNEH